MFFFEGNSWINATMISMFRYFAIAGLAFAVFYIWKKQRWSHLKIQKKSPQRAEIRRDILRSARTILIYNSAAGLQLFAYKTHLTKIYRDIDDYGMMYFIASIFLMILLHDAYYYWTHRWMHESSWLYKFHDDHHSTHSPNPFSAFSVHPIEALMTLGIIPVIIFLIPTHPLALMIFLVIMTGYSVFLHLGYEVVPKSMKNHSIGKWQNSTTNHDFHHDVGGGCNYGLYFSFWDRVMGTFRDSEIDEPKPIAPAIAEAFKPERNERD